MLKLIAALDGVSCEVWDFDQLAEEAAADGFEFYNEMFGDPDNNMSSVTVKVRYTGESNEEEFDVRIYIVQNPLVPQIDIRDLTGLWDDLAKRRVSHFLAEQEEKQNSVFPEFKKRQARRKRMKNGWQPKPPTIDDIPF